MDNQKTNKKHIIIATYFIIFFAVIFFLILNMVKKSHSDFFFSVDMNQIYSSVAIEKIKNQNKGDHIFSSIYYGTKEVGNDQIIVNYIKATIKPEWFSSVGMNNYKTSFVNFNYSFFTDDILKEEDHIKINIIAELINEKRNVIFQQQSNSSKNNREIIFAGNVENNTKAFFIILEKDKSNEWAFSIQYQSDLNNPEHELHKYTTASEARKNFIKPI